MAELCRALRRVRPNREKPEIPAGGRLQCSCADHCGSAARARDAPGRCLDNARLKGWVIRIAPPESRELIRGSSGLAGCILVVMRR